MASLRAVAAGVLAFLGVSVALLVSQAPSLLVVGFVPGGVTAALAEPGGRSGLLHGLLVGACCTGLLWVGLAALVVTVRPDYVAPGFGLSLFVLWLFSLLVGVESVVAGGLVGFARR